MILHNENENQIKKSVFSIIEYLKTKKNIELIIQNDEDICMINGGNTRIWYNADESCFNSIGAGQNWWDRSPRDLEENELKQKLERIEESQQNEDYWDENNDVEYCSFQYINPMF